MKNSITTYRELHVTSTSARPRKPVSQVRFGKESDGKHTHKKKKNPWKTVSITNSSSNSRKLKTLSSEIQLQKLVVRVAITPHGR